MLFLLFFHNHGSFNSTKKSGKGRHEKFEKLAQLLVLHLVPLIISCMMKHGVGWSTIYYRELYHNRVNQLS